MKYLVRKQVLPTVESPINIKLSTPCPLISPTFLSTASDTIFVGISFFVSLTSWFIFINNSFKFSPFFNEISWFSIDGLASRKSLISKLVTCLVLSWSNLFCTSILFKYGNFSIFMTFNKSFTNLKLSGAVISIKNNAHWHSYKNELIVATSWIKVSSILTSYTFKSRDFPLSNSPEILLVITAI